MRTLAMILTLTLSSLAIASDTKPSFDQVVYESDIVSEKIQAGFGTMKLLEVVDQVEVRPVYDELKSMGVISVAVQKLHASSYHSSKRTVYTFTATQRRGWTGKKDVAYFTVETYYLTGISDADPTRYKVSEIIKID